MYFAGVLLLIVLISIGWHALGTAADPTAAPRGEVDTLQVAVDADEVTVTPPGQESHSVSEPILTPAGTRIRTDETGQARLTVSSSTTAVLDGASDVRIARTDRSTRQTRLVLQSGQLFSHARDAFEDGGFYEVRTPNSVTAGNGAAFNISYRNGETQVSVVRGAVQVTRRDSEKGDVAYNTTQKVNGGEMAVVSNGRITTNGVSQTVRASEWFQQHAESIATSSIAGDSLAIQRLSATAVTLRDGQTDTVTLHGSNLGAVSTVKIGRFTLKSFETRGEGRIDVRLPYELPDGTFAVTVEAADGQSATAPIQLTLSHRDTTPLPDNPQG